ncbi:MAG: NADH:ubiquinone reductase (Na(+)-transporting) subunit C [Bacteroidales bacterium]|jgi:Na+-transporting NADH:ubiquinone oxidoreductase subunit C|nr:NADH:ubiquinone reductase (Na(+)-transporting) subunit C [Bacteroidales bacterium]
MKNFSNRYIFIYISVLVLVVAVLLSVAAVSLKPLQKENREKEKIAQILQAAGYTDIQGDILVKYREVAEVINIPQEGSKDSLSLIKIKNQKDGSYNYVISLEGKGLWGPLWGYICIGEDGNTVKGAVFAHKGETPGLGAEIEKPKFANTFIGKMLFDENGEFVSVKVVKGGVANSTINPIHGVDAISGGTVTSNGVDKMLYNCLSKYVPFFQFLKQEPTADLDNVNSEIEEVSENNINE